MWTIIDRYGDNNGEKLVLWQKRVHHGINRIRRHMSTGKTSAVRSRPRRRIPAPPAEEREGNQRETGRDQEELGI